MISIFSFLIFTALVAFISWYQTRKEDVADAKGYFLAGKSLPWFVITGSLLLTNLSTEQLVGLNGGAYLNGAIVMAWEVIAAIALVIMAVYFLPKYWKGNITTVPQFLEQRFDKATRRILGAIFLLSLVVNLLPFVLYSGAIAMNGLFKVHELFGVSHENSILIMVWAIGIVGAIYAIFGGLKAVAVSDTINGVGLLIGGLIIPLLGIFALGDGNFFGGIDRLFEGQSKQMDPVGGSESAIPVGTLFTGLILANVFYWCTNQAIVQRVFGAKSLAEGQKGVIGAAFLKLLGPLYLVLPGIIALELFGPDLKNGDFAYPMLVDAVLPKHLVGLFGAIMFGAILSSFNSALHSAATLFSLDIYKSVINPKASDRKAVTVGKLFAAVLAILAMIAAPQIAKTPDGLYNLMKQINAIFNIPILAVIVMGMLTKNVSATAAKTSLFLGMAIFTSYKYLLGGIVFGFNIHWLHFAGMNFVFLCAFMYFHPQKAEANTAQATTITINDEPSWGGLKASSITIVTLVPIMYFVLHYIGNK